MLRVDVAVPPAVAPHLPDLEAALPHAPSGVGRFWRVELSTREPERVRHFAVVRLVGQAMVREERAERIEIPVARAVLGSRPEPPSSVGEELTYAFVSGLESTEPHRCSSCAPHAPGHQPCPSCEGRRSVDCGFCEGTGRITCAVCDGSSEVVWGRAVMGAFRSVVVERTFLPAPMTGPIWALRRRLEGAPVVEGLRLPLEARSGRGPYRDAPVTDDAFHGFGYGDALERARQQAVKVQAGSIQAELALFVVPVTEVRWRSFVREHLALLVRDPDGPQAWILGGS